jgi:hypothetical protein
MSSEEMNKFLESIGGLENGWRRDYGAIVDSGFFSIGKGWYQIVKDLIEDLIELGWDKQVVQVKEKFGGLRFYINEGSREIHDRISEAEKLSHETCEICGKQGEMRTDIGWYSTLCNKHYEERKSNIQR